MPVLEYMTWVAGRKGWMKKLPVELARIAGKKMESVSCRQLGTAPTKEASRKAANEWWAARQAELERHSDRQKLADEFAELASVADPEQRQGLLNRREEVLAATGPVDRWERPLVGTSSEGKSAWQDRLNRKKSKGLPSIAVLAAKWLEGLKLRVETNELSIGRQNSYRIVIERFVDWSFGKDVSEINGLMLTDYQTHLRKLVTAKTISASYAASNLTSVKTFIRWLAETAEVIDPPRNLNSKALHIESKSKDPVTLSKSTIKQLLEGAAIVPRTRLFLLLMLNCGMYQSDISALKKSEIDFDKGTIKRPRTKTPDGPKVTWYLWPQTLQLLKQELEKADSENALLNEDGGLLVQEYFDESGKYQKSDAIKNSMYRLCQRLKIKNVPLKVLRKTAASELAEHDNYKYFAQYFLAHSPKSVADKSYVIPSERQFKEACEWLGEQFLGKKTK